MSRARATLRRKERQQVRVYTPELAREVYDVLMELGAPEHDFVLFSRCMSYEDNRPPWHFGKFEFNPTTCQMARHWRFKNAKLPKNFGEVNNKLTEIQKRIPLVDLEQ